MKNEYLILLIVVIVGLIAIFSLAFLMTGDYDLTGAAWGGGGECEDWDKEISMEQPKNKRDCEAAGGTWKEAAQ
ncbi:MAG: hypothetical protein GTN76_11825 [Candidatus Aenigmarchaeota archaeon]|nr:hypothetical protein [Candidatus Aenigmarchaeota archaeon]